MKGLCVATAAAVTLVVACSPEQASSSGDNGNCTSHYNPVADAPTWVALKKNLLEEVEPRVRSLRVIDKDSGHDKVVVNLLNRKHRLVMSLDVWQEDDGTWTARQWSQCID